jgi:SNF2 family DNA or RNA helicase
VETARDGTSLRVQACIVYGDPPCAEVREGRLVHLGGPHPVRDRIAEARLEQDARRTLGIVPGAAMRLDAREAIALRPRLERLGRDVAGDAHRAFFLADPLEPDLRVETERFGAEFRSGTRSVAAEAVLGAWRAGESLVALEGGGFAELPHEWLQRSGRVLADLLAARDAEGRLPRAALFDLAHLCTLEGRPAPELFERLRALAGFAALPPAELPADLRAELRGYQRDGVRWLQFLRGAGLGGLLADDMGLGKTLEALCSMRGRTLVVCPTSVLVAWREQAARFRPSLRVSLYHGPRRALDPTADLTLTTYALLRLDAEALASVAWDSLILDEAQAIKNPASQSARAAFRLRGEFRLAMTGTPVENRLEELWSELHFANPGLLGARDAFDESFGRPIAAGDAEATADLRRRVRPFLLRRRKREVAPELPPRTESVLHCELDTGERAVYDAVRAATRSDLVARLEAGGGVIEALEALLRLRQAACHTGLVPGQRAERSSKLELLVETLDEVVAEGHKALVFSQWTQLLDRVEPALARAGLAFARIDGSTRDRAGVVERFQADDGPPVLLISLRAGGTGLTLTAADHVFLLDPWWNPAVEDQAADRTHRIGQERPVFVYRLVARDTVEERILLLQERKRALAEAALGEATGAASLTREDLLALLAD